MSQKTIAWRLESAGTAGQKRLTAALLVGSFPASENSSAKRSEANLPNSTTTTTTLGVAI